MAFKDSVEDVSIQQVLGLTMPRIKKDMKNSGEMEIFCPLNPDESFEVNVANGKFKCWQSCANCPVEGKGGAINLYRLFNPGLSFYDAYKAIKEGTSVPVSEADKKRCKKYEASIPKETKMASVEDRDKTYRAFLGMLSLTSKHKKDLLKRGLKEDQIEEFSAKSMPVCGVRTIPKKLLAMGCKLDGVPIFGKDERGWMLCTPKGKTGFFIPYYDQNGKIQQIQIRYDVKVTSDMTPEEVAEAKKNRYRWGSSSGSDGGCSASNGTVFWGYKPPVSDKTLFITEGGLKACVANSLSGDWFCAIPGVSCYAALEIVFAECKKRGIETVVDAFDMDGKIMLDEKIIKDSEDNSKYITVEGPLYGKRQIKRSVYNALQKIHKMAEKKGIALTTWTWNPEFKGVDDYLQAKVMVGEDGRFNKNVETVIDEPVVDETASNEPVKEDAVKVSSAVFPPLPKAMPIPSGGPFIPINLPSVC